MSSGTHHKPMGLLPTGWLRRRHRVEQPARPAYPRIVAPDENATAIPPYDLFAFDSPIPARWREARVEEAAPVAAVSPADLLNLAGRAAWPEEHPAGRAIAAAIEASGCEDTPLQRAGIWHVSAGRGIQGYLNGYHVLIGNDQLMRDGGIPVSEDVREHLARHVEQGWQTLLIGARASSADREDVHRSLIGLLAVAPALMTGELAEPSPAQVHEPEHLDINAMTAPLADEPAAPPRRAPWRLAVPLVLISAAAGVYKSALTVRSEEVAVIRRAGRVTDVRGPGLHFRPLWFVETVTRIPRETGSVAGEAAASPDVETTHARTGSPSLSVSAHQADSTAAPPTVRPAHEQQQEWDLLAAFGLIPAAGARPDTCPANVGPASLPGDFSALPSPSSDSAAPP